MKTESGAPALNDRVVWMLIIAQQDNPAGSVTPRPKNFSIWQQSRFLIGKLAKLEKKGGEEMSLNLRNLHNGRENAYTFVCGDNNDPCRWGKAELLNGHYVRELPVTRWEFEVMGREEIRIRLRKDRGGVLYWEFSQLPKEFVRPYRWPDSFRIPTYNLEFLVNNVCEEVDKKRADALLTKELPERVSSTRILLAKVACSYDPARRYCAVYEIGQQNEASLGAYDLFIDGHRINTGLVRTWERKWRWEKQPGQETVQAVREKGLPVDDYREPVEDESAKSDSIFDQPFPHPEWGTSPDEFYSRPENRFED